MILFLHEDLANLLGHGELSDLLTLPDSLPIVANGLVFVVEIESQHLTRFAGKFHRLRRRSRHLAQVVYLARDRKRVFELLLGMLLELVGNVHVFRALQHLGINHIGDDRLVLARQILVEKLRQLFSGNCILSHFCPRFTKLSRGRRRTMHKCSTITHARGQSFPDVAGLALFGFNAARGWPPTSWDSRASSRMPSPDRPGSPP